MENPVHAGHQFGEKGLIADVTLDELDLIAGLLPREVGGIAEREVVEHDDGGSTAAKSLGDV